MITAQFALKLTHENSIIPYLGNIENEILENARKGRSFCEYTAGIIPNRVMSEIISELIKKGYSVSNVHNYKSIKISWEIPYLNQHESNT